MSAISGEQATIPAPEGKDESKRTEPPTYAEREKKSILKTMLELSNFFDWSDVDTETVSVWKNLLRQWFKSPPTHLSEEEETSIRHMLYIIATSDLLPNSVDSALSVLRIVRQWPDDISEKIGDNGELSRIVLALASKRNVPLAAFSNLATSYKEVDGPGILETLRILQEHEMEGEAEALLGRQQAGRLLLSNDRRHVLRALKIVSYNISSVAELDLTNNMRNAPDKARRHLVEQALDREDWESSESSLEFVRWALSRKNRWQQIPTASAVLRACQAILRDQSIEQSNDALHFVYRLVDGIPSGEEQITRSFPERNDSEEVDDENHEMGDRRDGVPEGEETLEEDVVEIDGQEEAGSKGKEPSKVVEQDGKEADAGGEQAAGSEREDGGQPSQDVQGAGVDQVAPDVDTELEFAWERTSACSPEAWVLFDLDDDEDFTARPQKALTLEDIESILRRHRVRSGPPQKRGKALAEESLRDYVRDLNRLPKDIFPSQPEDTIEFLEGKYGASTINKMVTRIDTFMHCLENNEEDQIAYFGSTRMYRYALAVFHEQRLTENEKDTLRRNQPAVLAEREQKLYVSLEKLETAYADMLEKLRRMLQGRNADRWLLQEYVLIALYQEQPPMRSREFQMLKYNPEEVTKDTNYVCDDRLVIRKDKVSDAKGQYIYDLKAAPELRQAIKLLISLHQEAGKERGFLFQRRDGEGLSREGFRKATYRAFTNLVGKGLGCRILRKIVQSGLTERGDMRWPEQRREFHQKSRHSASVAERHYIVRVSTPAEEAGTAKLTEAPKRKERNDDRSDGGAKKQRTGGSGKPKVRETTPILISDSDDSSRDASPTPSTASRRDRPRRRAPSPGLPAEWESADEYGSGNVVKRENRKRAVWDEDCVEWFNSNREQYMTPHGASMRHDWQRMAQDMNAELGTCFDAKKLSNRYENLKKLAA